MKKVIASPALNFYREVNSHDFDPQINYRNVISHFEKFEYEEALLALKTIRRSLCCYKFNHSTSLNVFDNLKKLTKVFKLNDEFYKCSDLKAKPSDVPNLTKLEGVFGFQFDKKLFPVKKFTSVTTDHSFYVIIKPDSVKHGKSKNKHELEVSNILRRFKGIEDFVELPFIFEDKPDFLLFSKFSGMDLFAYLDKKKITEALIHDFKKFVMEGLTFLHKRRIYHLDIKPENIVVESGEGKFKFKFIDFNGAELPFVKRVSQRTKEYYSPEYCFFNAKDFHKEYDWYSVSLILLDLMHDIHPEEIYHFFKDKMKRNSFSFNEIDRIDFERPFVENFLQEQLTNLKLLSYPTSCKKGMENLLKSRMALFEKNDEFKHDEVNDNEIQQKVKNIVVTCFPNGSHEIML